MNRSLPSSALTWFRNRGLSLPDIESLIDLIPGAAILIDFHRQKIALANAAMTEITAFTRSELVNQGLEGLLPALARYKFSGDTSPGAVMFKDLLSTHNGTSLDVRVGLHFLNKSGSWALAIIETIARYENQLASDQRLIERLSDIQNLVNCYLESEENQAILNILEIGQKMTGATHLGVYLVQAYSPELRRFLFIGPGDSLPEVIKPDVAWSEQDFQVWKPGKRASTDLHRIARRERFSYLVTKTLGEESRVVGLLVLAGVDTRLPSDFEPLLAILSTTITGIIQQKAFQEHLISNNQKTRRKLLIGDTFIGSCQEGLIILSPDLVIEEMNPAAESLLGYATREVKGQAIGNVMIGPSNLIPALQAAQAGISSPNLGEVHLVRRDGSTFLAHISTVPLILSDILEGIAIFLRDLSEHEQYEVQNQQLEQRALLGEVTAIFAHEVRNPINNISTGLQLLSMGLPDDHPNQELISRLSYDCNRLTHLMQEILTFSKPAEKKLEVIDLRELLPTIVERWRPRLARFNIAYEVHLVARKAQILGDPRALEQVFNNLISNAIEAMKETGGKLSVNIRPSRSISGKEYVEINVIDTGPGIPEQIVDRIFDPFFTVGRNGTGLGLSIAKRIVDKHKGTINVTSVPGGTVFQTVFPVTQPDEVEIRS